MFIGIIVIVWGFNMVYLYFLLFLVLIVFVLFIKLGCFVVFVGFNDELFGLLLLGWFLLVM